MKTTIWITGLAMLFLMAIPVLGAPVPTTEPTLATIIKAGAGNLTETRSVGQMEIVYWNETIDARLVMGWKCTLENTKTRKVVEVCDVQKNVLIDPEIFDTGEWIQWYPFEEKRANLVAFYVEAERKPFVSGIYNNTEQNQTLNETGAFPGDLENVRVSDILIPRGFPFHYDLNSTGYFDPELETRAWIFGEGDMLLDIPVENNMLDIGTDQSEKLRAGPHTIILIQGGPNLILEEKLVNEMDSDSPNMALHIESPFRRVNSIEIGGTLENPGMPPRRIASELQKWISENSDDDVMTLILFVEEPSIEIKSIDEIYRNNQTLWYVRGYTNLPNESRIIGVVDEGDQISLNTLRQASVQSTTFGVDPGSMRQFAIALPVDLELMYPGPHFVTIRVSDDVYSTVPRWVYNIPEGQEKPVLQTKYSGGNLFVPAPTPEIIIQNVTVPGPVQYVYVTITPEPTPTPDQVPVYFQSPWKYLLVVVVALMLVLVVLWIIYKKRH